MTALPKLVLTRDLASIGAGTRQLPAAVRAGVLVRVRQGVYVDAAAWNGLKPWEQYRLRVVAAGETCHSPTIFSHHSAATTMGIPTIERGQPVHALTTFRGGGRSRAGIRRHLVDAGTIDAHEADGLLITSRIQTVLDLAAFVPFAEALVPLDHVLKPDPGRSLPPLSKEELLDALPARYTPAAERRVRAAIEFASPESGSAGESYSRGLIHLAGFAAPTLQYEIRNSRGRIGWSDFYWEHSRTVGEFDGFAKYEKAEYLKGRTPGQVVVAEKMREDSIRATGRNVVRWVWSDLWTAGELERKLSDAGVPRRRRPSVGRDNGPGTP
ncbi:hypothetical protein [Arthrobacter sp. UYEF21]|uniref:hypothetical protein n=1 Tax=Arthrobacter sp. UYEF21 TaxID=1756364 RepID=UPI003398EDD4